jgi:hypothetical protein
MNKDDWLSFYTAASEIEQQHRISGAEAQKKLRTACREELIRTRKAPTDDGFLLPFEFWTRVAPSEWSRQVDYDGPDKDGCAIEVMIFEPDFRSWFGQPQSDRDAAIAKRLRKGVPGKDVAWKSFCDDIRRDCEASMNTRGFSDETIENITRKIMK